MNRRKKKEMQDDRRREKKLKKQGRDKEGSSTLIVETKFERIARKAKYKKEKVVAYLFHIKVNEQGIRALIEEKKDVKLRERETLLM